MSGISDLDELLASMAPSLKPGEFVFLNFPGCHYGDHATLQPVASFVEDEGLTLVVPKDQAETLNLKVTETFRMITLNVHSSLTAVGLTAAFAEALTEQGISANVIAAYYHDHVFVQAGRASDALNTLKALTKRAQR